MVAPSQMPAAPTFIPTGYSAVTINSAKGTASTQLIAPQPNQGYFITELGYQITFNATQTAAGNINLIFTDSTFGTVSNFTFFLPTTVTNPTGPFTSRQVTTPPLVWVSTVPNTSLSVAVDTALTGGSVRAFCRYGYLYGAL